MGAITAANAVVTLTIPPLFPNAQVLQGFAADDVFDTPAIKSIETMMGVDGILSGGFVFVEIPWNIALQADSKSNDLFDTWWTQMQAAKDIFPAFVQIVLPAIKRKYNLNNGMLTGYKPGPDAKKVLQPRKHTITFGSFNPAPTN